MTSFKRIKRLVAVGLLGFTSLLPILTLLLMSAPVALEAQDLTGPEEYPVVVVGPLPPRPQLCVRVKNCLGGVMDNFAKPSEHATPSSWLRDELRSCEGVHTKFDTPPPKGSCFGHSFDNCWLPACQLAGLQLQIHMQPARDLSDNDKIMIFSGGKQLWSKPIKALPEAHGTWNQRRNQSTLFFIDLDALPGGVSISNQLADSVDVAVLDDTQIDFMRLVVRVGCCGRACGTKYEDKNGNGLQDGNEPPLCGWSMVLDDGKGNARTTTTDSNGNYCFNQIKPGTYTLGEMAKTGWTQTAPPLPGQHILNIAPGVELSHLDFGNRICDVDSTRGFALDFDGKDDYVEVVDTASLNAIGADDFTIEAWINGLESEQGNHPPIAHNRSNHNDGFYFGFHDPWNGSANMIPFIRLGGVNWTAYPVQPNLLDGDWHHFAVTRKGKKLTYFADGIEVGSFIHGAIDSANIATGSPLLMGRDPLTSAFDGKIDDLCIWSVARTQAEIQADMASLSACPAKNTVACWSMDEGQGQITVDSTSGLDGQLGSSPNADASDPKWVIH